MEQERMINLIERVKTGDREAYDEVVSWFNKNKDIMIPGVAKSMRKTINYAKRFF